MKLILSLSFQVVLYCLCINIDDVYGQISSRRDIPNLEEIFSWRQISYNFENDGNVISNRYGFPRRDQSSGKLAFPTEKSTTTTNGQARDSDEGDENKFFIQYNNVPMGVSRWKDKLFITVPRRRYGIPSTLNYLSLIDDTSSKSPGLRPYPNLQTNSYRDRASKVNDRPLISVYRTRVDECDRLWMVDTGLLEVPNANQQLQPPAIVIFDLNTNRILRRFEITEDILVHNTTTGLASITVDIDNRDCNNAHAYIPDLSQYGLIVYSFRKNRAWRVRHNYFYLDPQGGDYEINGLRFQWNDGVFSVALTSKLLNNSKAAIFHPMSGTKEYAVSTNILKDEDLATRDFHGDDFMLLGDRGNNTQTAIHDVHEPTGVVLYGQVGRNAIACWNTAKAFTESNHVTLAKDDNKLVYPADLHVDMQDEGWVMTNRLPFYNYASLNPNDTNYRIHRFHIPTIIAGTSCDIRSSTARQPGYSRVTRNRWTRSY